MLFSYFRFFGIPYTWSEFDINSGFCGVLQNKFKKIADADADFGTDSYASMYDVDGDWKLRQGYVISRVYSNILFFMKTLMFRIDHDYSL